MQSDHGNVLRIGRRTSLRLSRRTQPGTPLAIATLSWARVKGADGRLTHRALKPSDFVETLKTVCQANANGLDLILCSGRPLTRRPPAADLADATRSVAVLFEVSTGKQPHEWIVSTPKGLIKLRSGQG